MRSIKVKAAGGIIALGAVLALIAPMSRTSSIAIAIVAVALALIAGGILLLTWVAGESRD